MVESKLDDQKVKDVVKEEENTIKNKTTSGEQISGFDNLDKSSSAPYLMWGSSSVDLSQAHSATTNLTTAPRGF